MTPNELVKFYLLARIINWRHELELLDAQAVADLIKILKSANNTLRLKIEQELPQVWASYTPDKGGAAIRLWLGELLTDPAMQVENTITEAWSISAQSSLAAYNDILSFGGLAKNILTVPITVDAIKGLASKKLFAGYTMGQLVAKSFTEGQITAVIDALNNGIKQGWGYPKVIDDLEQKALEAGAEINRRQAITLARSYIQQASVNAQLSVYENNKNIVKGVEWCSILDNKICELCAATDGILYTFEEEKPPMPRHPRCLLPENFVVAPDRIAAFISTYSGSIYEFIFTSGARLSVTANHMFLTDKGFTPAHTLHKGDNVLYSPRHSIRAKSAIIPNDNWKPSRIYDIVETLSKTPGMITVQMPISTEDLHGDAKFGDGYVNIILPDCFLRNYIDTSFLKSICKDYFALTDIGQISFSTECNPIDERFWLWLASGCHMSGLSIAEVFSRCSFGHHNTVGSGIIPNLNGVQFQNSPNYNTANPEAICERIFRNSRQVCRNDFILRQSIKREKRSSDSVFTQKSSDSVIGTSVSISDFLNRFKGMVTLDNIVSVKEKFFSGQVYDLQTLTSLYYIDGIIASNCRCLWLPWVKSWRDLGIDADDLEKAARPWVIREKGNIDEGGLRKIENFGKTTEDFPGWWATLPYQEQIRTIGPVRTKLINSGILTWRDLMDKHTGHFYTLKQLGFSESGKLL